MVYYECRSWSNAYDIGEMATTSIMIMNNVGLEMVGVGGGDGVELLHKIYWT